MMMDNNRLNANEGLKLRNVCTWRSGNIAHSRFYQCKLLNISFSQDHCRISIDARGEQDLRSPFDSTLAVVTLTPRSAEGFEPSLLSQGHEVPGTEDPRGFVPFEAVHGALKPQALRLFARQPGHYKGILQWPKHQVLSWLEPGRSLVFCYACDLGSSRILSYQSFWPDYSTAVILTVPHGSCFQDVWKSTREFQAIEEQEEMLLNETLEQEQERWADRPAWIAARQQWWPEHRPTSGVWQVSTEDQMHDEGGFEWLAGWGGIEDSDEDESVEDELDDSD